MEHGTNQTPYVRGEDYRGWLSNLRTSFAMMTQDPRKRVWLIGYVVDEWQHLQQLAGPDAPAGAELTDAERVQLLSVLLEAGDADR